MFEVKLSQNHMATTFHFTVVCELERYLEAEHLLEKSHELIEQLENELSEFRECSPIYQINHAARGSTVKLSQAGQALYALSEKLAQITGNAFNPAAKSLQKNLQQFSFRPETGEITKLVDGARLSFGAIGKGYALDRVKLMLEATGFKNYLLNAGGSSLVISGEWKWSWAWRKNPAGEYQGTELFHANGEAVAIGVSGTLEQGNHILATHENYSQTVQSLQSALVAHPSAAVSDALSTALFVAGWEKGSELLAPVTPHCAIASIDRSGVASYNRAFKNLWGTLCLFVFSIQSVLANEGEEQSLDLNALAEDRFNPYLGERNWLWALLPVISLVLVFLHLKQTKKDSKGYYKTGGKK